MHVDVPSKPAPVSFVSLLLDVELELKSFYCLGAGKACVEAGQDYSHCPEGAFRSSSS